MARPNPIRRIMECALPSITYQRRRLFRVGPEEVKYAYKIINKYVFDNKLHRPPIEIGITRDYWGICEGLDYETGHNTYSKLKISDKYFCAQWFMNVLAHEMAHQYQWDIVTPAREQEGMQPVLSHGPTFFMWRDEFEYYGLHLKTAHGQRRWFQHQDFNKC